MVLHDGMGLNWQGYYTTGLVDYYGRARRALADNYSDTVKLVVLLGSIWPINITADIMRKPRTSFLS